MAITIVYHNQIIPRKYKFQPANMIADISALIFKKYYINTEEKKKPSKIVKSLEF